MRYQEGGAVEAAKRAEDSHAQLEIERGSREQVEGQQEQLHKESERRKAAFQQAPQAAVGGIKRKLQAENKKLIEQLGEAEEKLIESEGRCTDLERMMLSAQQESESRKRAAAAVELAKRAAEKAAAEGVQAKIDAVQRLGEAEAELDTRLLQTEYRKETIPGGGAADTAARGADEFMWTAWREVQEEDY